MEAEVWFKLLTIYGPLFVVFLLVVLFMIASGRWLRKRADLAFDAHMQLVGSLNSAIPEIRTASTATAESVADMKQVVADHASREELFMQEVKGTQSQLAACYEKLCERRATA